MVFKYVLTSTPYVLYGTSYTLRVMCDAVRLTQYEVRVTKYVLCGTKYVLCRYVPCGYPYTTSPPLFAFKGLFSFRKRFCFLDLKIKNGWSFHFWNSNF